MNFIIFLFILSLIYILYDNGVASFSCKSALMFYEKFGNSNNNHYASFKYCSGYTRNVFKFEQSRIYTFNLETELSKGEVYVEVMDCTKNILFTLKESSPTKDYPVESHTKYFFKVHFKKASGKYTLSWS